MDGDCGGYCDCCDCYNDYCLVWSCVLGMGSRVDMLMSKLGMVMMIMMTRWKILIDDVAAVPWLLERYLLTRVLLLTFNFLLIVS